jgi:hypothetical protein
VCPFEQNQRTPSLPIGIEPVFIEWDPVMDSHPELGESGDVEIDRYPFFVEQNDVKFAVDPPPDLTDFEVSLAITATGGIFKFEIIVRTSDLNHTAIESCLVIE